MTLNLFPEMNIISFPMTRVRRRRRKQTVGQVVVPFPLARRTVTVLRIAEDLESREGKIRDDFWYAAVQALREQLAAANLSEEVILREIRSFRSAVQFAIDFHRFGDTPNGRDGAA
ncbi:DUF6074 family protein [Mesorhizobium sp. M0959]|uniref:DUF6074 family protein n=1 Tax=Mesorhizobium sp. M0959 TaxID=2957034 RepID=UPI00333643AE